MGLERGMFKFTLLKGILLVSLSAVIALPAYFFFFMSPSVSRLIAETAEDEAVRIATHLAGMLLEESELKRETLPADFPHQVAKMKGDFNIVKVKVFSRTGEVVYSTDREDMGHINRERYFHETVVKGNTYAKVVKKDALTLEGQTMTVDVVETYVPVMRGGAFRGAFEIYMDITGKKKKLALLMSRSYVVLLIAVLGLLTAVGIASARAAMTIAGQKQAEDKILRQSMELKEMNAELSAIYEVSLAVSRKIEMDELLSVVLNTITGFKLFNVERKGGIFFVEGDRMRLVSHLGHTEEFLGLHKDMKVGDCLCGLAAMTGDIVISKNSAEDERHTITYPHITPHGHIVVPLKTMDRVVGVLYLYLPAGFDIGERKLRMLFSLGSQIATAIENARLYEDTKTLSLHDPLTGLANRRLMEINIEKSLAVSKRYGTPLSVIMLDIDFFKKYNDTYGHSSGDKLLAGIAGIILEAVRKSDFAVRYGGEEFLILLPGTGAGEAQIAAQRIRTSVEEKTEVTISLGVSSYREGMSREDIIGRADNALYLAKQKGRNRVEVSED
ncbi:MAG: GGDEF domain-containing protein [Thermodesulfovibrionales bacterium]|nr:GGDEF domain-containing protein [Thermodesulfovibrionales bacterium]